MDEQRTCRLCDETKPITDFYLRSGTPWRYRHCKECAKKLSTARVSEWRRNAKRILIQEAGGKCTDCGGVFPPFLYDFDHREPGHKSFTISHYANLSMAKLREEAAKCDLVCANCHRMRTHRQSCSGCEFCQSPITQLVE